MESRAQEHILFMLGACQEAYSQHFEKQPYTISLNKKAFIDLAMSANLAGKKERALYQNLENLEKRKCISYTNKNLSLTKKGVQKYEEIKKTINPFLSVCFTLSAENILKYTPTTTAVLKKN